MLNILLLFLIICMPANSESISTTKSVKQSVEIEGNTFISDEIIINLLDNESDPQGIELKLRDSGLFDSVSAKTSSMHANKKIKITVKEAPLITQIKFTGNKALKEDALNQITNLKPGIRYTQALDEKIRAKITGVYAAKNILATCMCKITPNIPTNISSNASSDISATDSKTNSASTKHSVNLEIIINETVESQISKVQFIGLQTITSKQLLRNITPTPTGFFSSSYELPMIELYKEKITSYAQNIGYHDFCIVGYSIKEIKKNVFTLFFIVNEGPKYTCNSVKVDNQTGIKTDAVKSDATKSDLMQKDSMEKDWIQTEIEENIRPLKNQKAILSLELINDTAKKIMQTFENHGHTVSVKTQINRTKQNSTAPTESQNSSTETASSAKASSDILFIIVNTKPTLINNITVSGNKTSNRNMIIRVSELNPGQTLTQKDLKTAKANLTNTGFFKAIDIELEQATETLTNLNIKTEEVNTILLSAGLDLGYGVTPYMKDMESTFFAGIKLGYCTPNFLGKGYSINANVGWVSGAKMFNVSFGQSALVNPRNIGWALNFGVVKHDGGIGFKHKEKESNTYTDPSDSPDKYLLPDFKYTSGTNPRLIDLSWESFKFNTSFDLSLALNKNFSVGLSPFLAVQTTTFKDREKFPRIFQEDMYFENNIRYGVEIPCVANFTERTLNKRYIGFGLQIKPVIDRYNAGVNLAASYTVPLDSDCVSTLGFKVSGGFLRSISDTNYWNENYKGTGFMTGVVSWGARELTSMTCLGGREYIAAQAKLILPIIFVPDFLKFYCFAAVGSIGNAGIKSEKISDEIAEKMGFRKGLDDVVNDEHSLRATAGLGVMFIMDASVISVGINFPLIYKENYDRVTVLNLNMTTSIDNA